MAWTEPSKAKEGVSHYDHVILETPIGKLIIEWKSWKDNDSYDIIFDNTTYVGSEMDLDSAKKLAETFIRNKSEELTKFVSILL